MAQSLIILHTLRVQVRLAWLHVGFLCVVVVSGLADHVCFSLGFRV